MLKIRLPHGHGKKHLDRHSSDAHNSHRRGVSRGDSHTVPGFPCCEASPLTCLYSWSSRGLLLADTGPDISDTILISLYRKQSQSASRTSTRIIRFSYIFFIISFNSDRVMFVSVELSLHIGVGFKYKGTGVVLLLENLQP